MLYTDDEVEALCMPHNQSFNRKSFRNSEREGHLKAAFEAERLPGYCAAFLQ